MTSAILTCEKHNHLLATRGSAENRVLRGAESTVEFESHAEAGGQTPDCAQDAREMKRKGSLRLTRASHESGFRCYQGQIGYGGRYQQPEERLSPAKVAGFAPKSGRERCRKPLSDFSGCSYALCWPNKSELLREEMLLLKTWPFGFARFLLVFL
jgi:hypothetical protein